MVTMLFCILYTEIP